MPIKWNKIYDFMIDLEENFSYIDSQYLYVLIVHRPKSRISFFFKEISVPLELIWYK